jgi:hypothetical protein
MKLVKLVQDLRKKAIELKIEIKKEEKRNRKYKK